MENYTHRHPHTGMDVPTPAPADVGSRTSTTPTPAPVRTPPLTSIFPKYAVLVFFLAALFVSLRATRTWIWRVCLSHLHLQATYHKNGIQFSHFRDWHIVEHTNERYEIAESKIAFSTLNINVEGPHNAVITFAIFDPAYSRTLDTYVNQMRTRFAAALDDQLILADPLEPVVGRIHGVNHNGIRYHFTAPSSVTSANSCYQYFYELRTPTNTIMLSLQLPEQSIDSPEVQLILDTIKLDGEISLADQHSRN